MKQFIWLAVCLAICKIAVVKNADTAGSSIKPKASKKPKPVVPTVEPFSCISDSGKETPWYVIYKLPSSAGDEYLYMDDGSQKWSLKKTFMAKNGPFMRTFAAFFDNPYKQNSLAIFYNKQPGPGGVPQRKTDSLSRGIVLATKSRLAWIVHSFPAFPATTLDGTVLRDKSTAGMLVCLSLDNQLAELGEFLQYENISIYYSHKGDAAIPQSVKQLLNGQPIESTPLRKVRRFRLLNAAQRNPIVFAKLGIIRQDIYSQFITLSSPPKRFTTIWNGKHSKPAQLLKAVCNPPYSLADYIASRKPPKAVVVKMDTDNGERSIRNSEDLSTWALQGNAMWCFSDLMHVPAQHEQSGGAVCFPSNGFPNLVRAFSAPAGAADLYTSCKRR
ncbi:unnamed protein product [Soboliphyme baturini]|uniref:Deoxyribonuclease II n=1 Tax=Soboliphyme baturini TaxID=241478 RepID=A0A183IVB9_9BILA|nr:unnamed protein product [Soboliphyme baturini]